MNKFKKREHIQPKNIENVSKMSEPQRETTLIYSNRLPEIITLPDGRTFTNQEIVSIKRLYKFGRDDENDKLWLEIEKYLLENKLVTKKQSVIKRNSINKERRVSKTIQIKR